MYNGIIDGLQRKLTGGILLLAMSVPLIGLSQDAVPVPPEEPPLIQVEPPRAFALNAKGEVIQLAVPDIPRVPLIHLEQGALKLDQLEEAMELNALELEMHALDMELFDVHAFEMHARDMDFDPFEMVIDVHDFEMQAYDLEMQAYELEQTLIDDCDCPDYIANGPWAVTAARGVRPVNRAGRARIAGQDPNPKVLPLPRDSRSRALGRTALALASTSTKDAYQVAYSLILDEKWREAGDALRTFIQSNTKNRYTDDATFWFAYSLEKLEGANEKVFDAYYAFVLLYPSSSWEDDAKANLIRLGSVLVKTDRKNRSKYEPIMTALRKDDDIKVAISALYGLSRIGDESSLKVIIGIYDETANKELRKNVVTTLARFDGELVVDKLAEIAMKDPDRDVRSAALQALARSDQSKAALVLGQLATTDVDSEVRLSAVRAMGRIRGSLQTITTLETIAKTDVHVKVRTEAVTALGRIGTIEAQEALVRILSGN